MAFISSDVPLNGVSGVHGSCERTRSMMPNRPRLRVAPTLGCLAASRRWCSRMTESSRAAFSIRPSSSYTEMVASEAARLTGWLL